MVTALNRNRTNKTRGSVGYPIFERCKPEWEIGWSEPALYRCTSATACLMFKMGLMQRICILKTLLPFHYHILPPPPPPKKEENCRSIFKYFRRRHLEKNKQLLTENNDDDRRHLSAGELKKKEKKKKRKKRSVQRWRVIDREVDRWMNITL